MTDIHRQTLSLDGRWRITFDAGDVGKTQGWHRPAVLEKHAGAEDIVVPSCWEGVRQDYEGVAWYCRRFAVPADWRDKSVRIQFDAANYRAEVYVNETPAGYHDGGYTGFELEVGDLLKFDEDNFVAVRVVGPILTSDRRIDGIGQNETPHWRGAITGGLWQSVRLVASAKTYIKDVFIEPSPSLATATARLEFESQSLQTTSLRINTYVTPADDHSKILIGIEQQLNLEPGISSMSVELPIGKTRLWSPDDPYLYCAHVEIREEKLPEEGDLVDRRVVRFGIREFTVENNRFFLNGEELFLKATFYEGLYAHTMACPPSEELIRRELRLAKDAGFNMLRPWRKPQPPMVYDLADEFGMLFVGAMPIECMRHWPALSPQMEERLAIEVRESVRRDRNHASIVCWELFNEIGRPELKRQKHKMSMLARSLDDSRMILDESGGFSGTAQVYLPRSREATPFNDVHNYPGAPINDELRDDFLAVARTDEELNELGIPEAKKRGSHSETGLLTYVSEIGYGSPPDLVDNVARYEAEGNPLTPDYRYTKALLASFEKTIADSPFAGIYPDVSTFIDEQQQIHADANKAMVEAARVNPYVGGYCVHAFTDGDWIVGGGLVDLFRQPKKPYYSTAKANLPVILHIRPERRNVTTGDQIAVKVTSASESLDATATLTVIATDAAGKEALRVEEAFHLAKGVGEPVVHQMETNDLSGIVTITATLTGDGETISANTTTIHVFDALEKSTGEVLLLGANDRLRTALEATGLTCREFEAGMTSGAPLLVAHPTHDQIDNARAALEYAEAGGAVIYLTLPGDGKFRWMANPTPLESPWLPAPIKTQNARGLWVGVAHIIKKHRVTEGLPSDLMMQDDYQNVYPITTIREIGEGAEVVAGSVSYGWNAGKPVYKRNHLGPEDAYWGADLVATPHGQGRVILSTLRLLPHLGSDPVADRLLRNIVAWASGRSE